MNALLLPLLILLLSVVTPHAEAHPRGAVQASHLLELYLEPDRVFLKYIMMLPTPMLLRELGPRASMTEAEGSAITEAKLRELAQGLLLRVNGERLTLRSLPLEEPTGLGNAQHIRYEIHLEADLPAAELWSLEWILTNYPEEHSFFNQRLFTAPQLRILESSLLDLEDGKLQRSHHDEWTMEEERRELRLSFRPARAFEDQEGEWRSGGAGLALPWHAELSGVLWGGAGLSAAGGLFLWSARRRRRRRALES